MKSNHRSRFSLGGLCLAAALILGGCAAKLTTQVTHFQRWPDNAAGQTFRMAPTPINAPNALEHQTYAGLIQTALESTGLTPVHTQNNATPRFLVSFEYASPMRQEWTQQWHNPYPFYPWWGLSHYYGGWGWGGGMHMMPALVPVTVYENTLTISIQDTQNDEQVFKTTARATTHRAQLPRVMPYLVRAVFDDFPGNNGQDREIKYEWARE